MITKEQAVALGNGTLKGPIYSMTTANGRDKNLRPAELRASGQCQTWKTRPSSFRLPIKYGLSKSYKIDQRNCCAFTLDENEARRALKLPEIEPMASDSSIIRTDARTALESSPAQWRVTVNGKLPGIICRTFEIAVGYVADQTGKTPESIRADHAAGCPTMQDDGDQSEYDIEQVKE